MAARPPVVRLPRAPLLAALGLLAAVAAAAQPSEREAIAASLDAYRSALLEVRGADAAEQVSSGTVAYYERVRRLALTGAEAEVRAEPLFDRINIISMRHYLEAGELQRLDGKGLIAKAIDLGLVDTGSSRDVGLGEVAVEGDQATGVYVYRGEPTPFRLHFVREDGRWRVDLLSFMRIGEPALRSVAEKAGMPEDEFIIALLTQASGRRPAADIWQPLVKE